jgi:hypothetical protein
MAVDKMAQREAGKEIRGKALAYAVMEAARKGQYKSKAQLLREAGYSESTIDGHANYAWTSRGFLSALADNGITADTVREKIDEAMQAGTVVAYKGDAIESDAPDYKVRLQAAQMLAKYTGLDVQRSQNVNVNIDLDTEKAVDFFGL